MEIDETGQHNRSQTESILDGRARRLAGDLQGDRAIHRRREIALNRARRVIQCRR